MALKKSELYSSLWKSCDELRGGMDASQYKDYVLILLFIKYVSDKYAGVPDALLDVPAGGSFADMVAAKGSKEIGDRINKIIGRLADANDSLKGAINVADFNDEEKLGKADAMVQRLTKLVAIFEGLDFGGNRAEGDDLLGDAYEYLMRHFATESGKSKGQFYTPAEVSRIMSMVIDLGKASDVLQSIYDPTCGSGSLLLKAHDEARNRTGLDLALYGQEMDNATSALARMNMVLHDCPTAQIWQDNTLSHPNFKNADGDLRTFDFVVANPPFSVKSWTTGFDPANDRYHRFEYGIPPAKNGDYAFPAAHAQEPQEYRQGGGDSSSRRPVPGRGRGRDSQEPGPARLHQKHHRLARQPVLRHGHPRLYSGAGQGRRYGPRGHLHDRCQQGLH